jgi:hypothetical protein
MNKKLHVVSFTVETDAEENKPKQDGGNDDGGDDGHKGAYEDNEADDLYDTDDGGPPNKDLPSSNSNDAMKTPTQKKVADLAVRLSMLLMFWRIPLNKRRF